ncbi:hypothetical protein GQR58_006653 [Nymphon striatum]|nr:hypothetical protein GQR58_006653 [Nymphon striatum]
MKSQGKSVAVTYCPLCGSGIVYAADFDGKAHKFGVSGLLYNSDVLLYDRQTETLWSQILSKGISGELVNKKLAVIQSAHTSWASWKEQYPETKVLSDKTGFSRDYDRSPYGSYDKDVSTYFPVAFKSKRYHPKERVLGITVNDKQKVYPFAELSKYANENNKTSLNDTFEGQELTLEFDMENRDGSFKNANGDVVTSTNTFWFAWNITMHKIMKGLQKDHQNLAQVLEIMELQLERIAEGDDSALALMFDASSYIQNYPDMIHHPKENKIFEVFKYRSNEEAESLEIREELVKNIQDYIELEWEHMNLEESVVFPLIDKTLEDKDWKLLEELIEADADPLFSDKIEDTFKTLYQSINAQAA